MFVLSLSDKLNDGSFVLKWKDFKYEDLYKFFEEKIQKKPGDVFVLSVTCKSRVFRVVQIFIINNDNSIRKILPDCLWMGQKKRQQSQNHKEKIVYEEWLKHIGDKRATNE